MKIPFAAVSWDRGTTSGIIESSAGAKNVVAIETAMLRSRRPAMFVSRSARSEEEAGADEVRDDQDLAPVEAVHVDAGQGAEQHRRARGRSG